MRKIFFTGLALATVGSFLVVGSAFAIPITGALSPILMVGYEKPTTDGSELIEMFGTGTLSYGTSTPSSSDYDPISGIFAGQGAQDANISWSAAVATSPVPEPATALLFGTALVGLAGVARRKKKD